MTFILQMLNNKHKNLRYETFCAIRHGLCYIIKVMRHIL